MAVTDAYATAATYRLITGKTDASEDAEILDDLTAVSRYLDRKLSRFFTKDTAGVIRVYDPNSIVDGTSRWVGDEYQVGAITVDDMAAVPTLVKVDEDRDGVFEKTLATTDYEVLPRNAALGPEPRPYNELRLLRSGTYPTWRDAAMVQVTAVWGWPAIPKAIERATCQLTAILRIESPRATNQISAGFDTVLGASRQAQDIVQELSRVYQKTWVYA